MTNSPISSYLEEYAKSDAVRLHMPGHKGRGSHGEALDITEITGADSLFEANGIIERSEGYASDIFGSKSFDKVLGIGLVEARARALEAKKEEKSEDAPEVSPEMLAYINEMIEARRKAKSEKNYAEADRIKTELIEKGITLIDTREGTKFTVTK